MIFTQDLILKFLTALAGVILLSFADAEAQTLLNGTITREDSIPLPGVTVLNKRSNSFVVSDQNGQYQLETKRGDTILLRALGYTPQLFIVTKDKTVIRHHLIAQPLELNTINIIRYNYLRDSQNLRNEFRKEFDFRRPRWNEVIPTVGPVIAININALYRAASIRKNRKKDRFKRILLDKEKENQVQRIFNPDMVSKLTGLQGDSLTQFMTKFQPTYEFIKNASGYDVYEYVKKQYSIYAGHENAMDM